MLLPDDNFDLDGAMVRAHCDVFTRFGIFCHDGPARAMQPVIDLALVYSIVMRPLEFESLVKVRVWKNKSL